MIENTKSISSHAEVILLSAGRGKRLGELTKEKPKPLVCLAGRELIDYNLERISLAGFKKVFINLHYKGEQIEKYVGDGSRWSLNVQFVHEKVLLDTGGAIKNIEHYLSCPYLVVINSDILLGNDFSISDVLRSHVRNTNKPVATLVLRKDENAKNFGEFGINKSGRIGMFLGKTYLDEILESGYMYVGVQVLSQEFFSYMSEAGSVFSITKDTLTKAIEENAFIQSYVCDSYWADLGTPERLKAAENYLLKNKAKHT